MVSDSPVIPSWPCRSVRWGLCLLPGDTNMFGYCLPAGKVALGHLEARPGQVLGQSELELRCLLVEQQVDSIPDSGLDLASRGVLEDELGKWGF